MIDGFGRTIEYMRVSVTDRCNLRCIHCMPEGFADLRAHADILRYEEIAVIAREAAALGIRKIRLTGGEPLVRPQLHRLVNLLKDIPGIEQVVLTTNGILLKEQLPDLLAAGLDGVNLSLNALDRESYRAFTGVDAFDEAMEGLRAALDALLSVKINCVPTKGREDQILKIAALARDTRAAVRFIELMPIGQGKALEGLPMDELRALLERTFGSPLRQAQGAPVEQVQSAPGEQAQKASDGQAQGPASYVRFPGFASDIGFIAAVSHRFCEDCNRIRLTADGRLKSCLAFPAGEDVRAVLRSGGSSADIRACLARCIQNKPQRHRFGLEETEESRLMSQIGG
ncbi:MAG: GTP 3',8-cyclase MoaA [Clostridia bacterium]|nr:GTP 3',8-cyclase MoaA [Clostridia bacterium]